MTVARVVAAFATTLAAVIAAGPAHAGSLTISSTTGRTGVGGEFKVSGFDNIVIPPAAAVTSIDGGDFNTFCIEYNESISLPGNYDYTIDSGAVNGGVSGGNPDPIGDATAKLYYMFWTDQWSVTTSGSAASSLVDITYDYSNSTQRGKDGADLQMAIWFLEGERTQSDVDDWVSSHAGSQAQKLIDLANDGDLTWALLGTDYSADLSGNHLGGVKVINLTQSGSPKQSQLVVVPLPASALMGLALLAVLAIAKGVRTRRLRMLV